MTKSEIRRTICQLLNHCNGCKKVQGMAQKNVLKFCLSECDHGKEMNRLSKLLLTDEKPSLEPKLDLETYLQYKRERWKDDDIAKDLEITFLTLSRYKKQWGIPKIKHGDRTKYLDEILSRIYGEWTFLEDV